MHQQACFACRSKACCYHSRLHQLQRPSLRRSKGHRKGRPGRQQVLMSKQTAALSKPPSCKWNCIMFCAPWYSLKLQLLMRHLLCFASVTMCRSTYNLVHRGEEIISTADTSCIVVCRCCWSVCTSTSVVPHLSTWLQHRPLVTKCMQLDQSQQASEQGS